MLEETNCASNAQMWSPNPLTYTTMIAQVDL